MDREYSQLTVVSAKRSLLGYLDVPEVQAKRKSYPADATVADAYTKFDRRKSVGYSLITPDTDLHTLENFLKQQKFAVVTDARRNFVLAIATQEDLDQFIQRRG